jgi:hypothetical protein
LITMEMAEATLVRLEILRAVAGVMALVGSGQMQRGARPLLKVIIQKR